MDHATRLDLARRITEYLRKHHANVLAVAVTGSAAKGEDRDHSDLELFAVTEGVPDTKYYQAIFGGIVVEVVFVGLEEAAAEVEGMGYEWPFAADGWIHHIALYDPEGVLPRLAYAAMEPSPGTSTEATKHALTALYEDLCKLRNLIAAREETLAHFVAGYVAFNAARFLGLLNRQYFNGVRNLLTKPREFQQLPSHFWEDYPPLLAAEGSSAQLLQRGERLYQGCLALGRASGEARPEPRTLEDALEAGRVAR